MIYLYSYQPIYLFLVSWVLKIFTLAAMRRPGVLPKSAQPGGYDVKEFPRAAEAYEQRMEARVPGGDKGGGPWGALPVGTQRAMWGVVSETDLSHLQKKSTERCEKN